MNKLSSPEERLEQLEIKVNELSNNLSLRYERSKRLVEIYTKLKEIEDEGERNPLFHYFPTWTKQGKEYNALLSEAMQLEIPGTASRNIVERLYDALPTLTDGIRIRREFLDREIIGLTIMFQEYNVEVFLNYYKISYSFVPSNYQIDQYALWNKFQAENKTLGNSVSFDLYKNFKVQSGLKWLYDKIQERNAKLPPEQRISWPNGEDIPKE